MTRRMTEKQQFYPYEIYVMHRVLTEQALVEEDSKTILFPSLFSKHSRSFHWMAIRPENWKFDDGVEKIFQLLEGKIQAEIKNKDKAPQEEWRSFKKSIPNLTRFKLAIDSLDPIFTKLCKDGNLEISLYKGGASQLHWHILSLYEGYQHHPQLNMDGIIYRNLEATRSGKGIAYITGKMRLGTDFKEEYHFSPWIETTFFDFSENPLLSIDKYQCQEATCSVSNKDSLSKPPKRAPDGYAFQLILKEMLFPTEGGLITPWLYIAPLYDFQLGDFSYGAIWGNLAFLFQSQDERDEFVDKKKKGKIAEASYLLIRELRHSAITNILSQPIEPPYDLISHFVQHLRILQDWERITVFQKEGEKYTPQYCYRWHKDNKNGKPIWKPCDCIHTNEPAVIGCCESWESLSEETAKDNKKYLRWELDFWDEAFIPGISKEEQQQFGSIYLAFEYPITSVIPSDSDTKQALDDLYIRQQLEVLRGLLSKIRARRSALRNAAVSIMGRNMSHNIGSHVLARYSASTLEETNKPDCLECEGVKEKYKSDVNKLQSKLDKCISLNKNNCYACNKNIEQYDLDVKQFTRYLQERMDFIADMSTTDVYYSMPTSFFEEALTGLFGKPDEIPEQKILLKYISGVDNVTVGVHVENKPGEDFVFASPGGQLGLQALYVILENIARNTAKHGNDDWEIEKDIQVEQDDEAGTLTLSFHHESLSDCSKVMLRSTNHDPDFDELDLNKVKINGHVEDGPNPKSLLTTGKGGIPKNNWTDDENSIIFDFDEDVEIPKLGDVSVTIQRDVVLHVQVRPADHLEKRYPEGWEERYLEVLVWDNSRNCSPEDDEWLPEKINRKMIHPVIDDSGAIKQGAWGIREIFLAAAYLRSISLSELEDRGVWPEKVNKYTSSPPILEALALDPDPDPDPDPEKPKPPPIITKEDNKRGRLAYRFYLKKDSILLEFYENKPWAENNPVLGTEVYNAKLNELSDLLQKKNPHSYGLFSETIFQNLDHTERLSLPVMHFSKKDFEQKKAPTEKDEIELLLAKTWWDKHLKNRIGVAEDNFVICRTGAGGPAEGGVEYISRDRLDNDIDSKYIVFDDHYNLPLEIASKAAFYEPFRSKDPQHAMLRDNMKKELNELLFKTAALTRIIILDERVQDQLSETYDNSWKWEQLFPLAGIVIPSRNGEINLNEIKGQKENFFPWLEKINNEESHRKIPFDFIVIHQGIIDKLREEMDKDRFDSDFKQQAEKMGCRDRIIVCSGRGNPRESLPHYARFIPVSGLLRWVIANPSKFNLVNLLSHARRPQGN